jgi:ankyrin repeat protein
MNQKHSSTFNTEAQNAKAMGYELLRFLDRQDVAEFTAVDMIRKGADLTVTDDDGNDALHHAAYWGHSVVVAALLSTDMERNRPNVSGMTPVMWACAAGQEDTACMIASDPKCRLDVRDGKKRTPADCAHDNDHCTLGSKMERAAVKKAENPSFRPC